MNIGDSEHNNLNKSRDSSGTEEVSDRSSNASLQQQPVSQQDSRTSPSEISSQRRCSRGAVHPTPKGLAVREAFGANKPGAFENDHTPNSEHVCGDSTSSILHKESEFQDSSAGLPGGLHPAEDSEALPNTETLMFRDGQRRIDMVLVYEEEELGVMTEAEMLRRERRRVFEENLVSEGLELELERKEMSYDQKTFFLKIHVPWKALTRYAEVMNLKMPTKGLKYVYKKSTNENIICTRLNTVKENIFPKAARDITNVVINSQRVHTCMPVCCIYCLA